MQDVKVWAIHMLNKYIRRNRILTRLIFGLNILDKSNIHWDFTTLVLKKALHQIVKYNNKILEIGTGPYAILALYFYKKGYYKIVASDINTNYIGIARQTATFNNADLVIVKSNLFSSIMGRYDIIFFNSVYIPEKIGKKLRLYTIHKYKTHWCSGESGTEIIENFLKYSVDYLLPHGKILLGFNPYYLPKQKMYNLCLSYNYTIQNEVKLPFIPSVVFTLLGGQK